MGSVIRVLSSPRRDVRQAVVHPTWRTGSRCFSLPLALTAARRIWGLDRSEIVHVHLAEKGSFVREGALVALARVLGMPTIVTIHGSGFRPFAERHRLLTSLVLRRAHVITCLDEKVATLARRLAPRAKVRVVPNPVALDPHRTSARETEEVVLFGGLVGLRKGADVLSAAWRIVAASRPRARCVVAGPAGDYRFPAMERLELRGAVASEEMQGLIRSARVVALPSRAEGMP
ncbi:MAG TPA: glycosyltransferase family 4 protein, partial [Solirubrobacteraceae bacterium]